MARYVDGEVSVSWRRTDHSEGIAALRARFVEAKTSLEAMACRTAAELLKGHGDTGISLDEWPGPRTVVEYLIGRPILPYEV